MTRETHWIHCHRKTLWLLVVVTGSFGGWLAHDWLPGMNMPQEVMSAGDGGPEAVSSDPGTPFDQWRQLPEEEQRQSLQSWLARLTAAEFPFVVQQFEAHFPKDAFHSPIWELLVECWAERDGPKAFEYGIEQFEGDQRLDVGSASIRGWMRRDPSRAARATVAMADVYGKDYLIYAAVRTWSEQMPKDALSWTREVPVEWKDTAQQHAALTLARSDPDGLAAWVNQHADARTDQRLIMEAAVAMTRKDPAVAAEWINGLEDANARTLALETMTDWMAAVNPGDTGEWLRRMAPGPETDRAYATYARAAWAHDPSTALEWAEAIEDAVLRQETLSVLSNGPDPD